MTTVPRRATWSVLLLFICCLATVSCVEEAFLLDDPVDFCGVPGTANVRACNYIVGELEDQNPSLDFDFVCSREEDCKDGILDGQVVDWYPSGCNGPKIKNKLCGCCVFIPMPEDIAPGAPTNLEESSVTSSSVTLTWEDGTRGIPVETYAVRCFDTEPMDCRSDDFAAEVTDIPRGTEIATVLGLEADSEYTCFVLAMNAAEPEGVCSDAVEVTTLPLPDFRLRIALEVDRCDAFEATAGIAAFCEAFIGEAGFPTDTACLTEESSCSEVLNDRRRLLNGQFEATIVLAGNFDGQDKEQVEETANAVLSDETRLTAVQTAAVIVLNERGTEDLADALGETTFTGGTSSAEDAAPECTTSEDCEASSTQPICSSDFCVACRPIQRPAAQGSCQDGAFCRLDGSCTLEQCESRADCSANLPVCVDDSCMACSPQETPAVQGNCLPGEFCREGGACSASQCDTDDDCTGTEPICMDGSCTACAPQETPAVQGNCPANEFCVLDGSCVPPEPPGIPTNVAESAVSSSSATFTWTDGSIGLPVETYAIRCFDTEPMDCTSDDFAAEVTDIPRGTEIATIPGLELNTEYTCFVLAENIAAPDGVCSDGATVTTLECETNDDCDGETPICENQECTSADFEVSNEADLRTALDEAEPGQSIQVVGEITLTTDDVNTPSLIIDKAITIVGKRDSVLQSPADASAAIILIQVNADDVSFSSGLGIRHLKNPVSDGEIDSAVRVNAESFASAADVEFVEFGYSLQGSFDISGSTAYVGVTGNTHRHIAIFSMTGTSTIEDVVFSFPDEVTPRSNAIFVNTETPGGVPERTFNGGLTVRNVIQQDLSIACRQFFNYEAGFANIVPGNSFLSFEGNAWNDRNGGIFLIFPTDDPLQRFEFVSVTNNFQGDNAVVEDAGYKGIFYVTAFSGSWEVGDVSNFFSSGNESPGQTDPSSLRSAFFWINVPGQEEFTLAFDGRVFVDPTE
eukprot:scaffold76_cov363-Pavlova_lutheri.AAC.19